MFPHFSRVFYYVYVSRNWKSEYESSTFGSSLILSTHTKLCHRRLQLATPICVTSHTCTNPSSIHTHLGAPRPHTGFHAARTPDIHSAVSTRHVPHHPEEAPGRSSKEEPNTVLRNAFHTHKTDTCDVFGLWLFFQFWKKKRHPPIDFQKQIQYSNMHTKETLNYTKNMFIFFQLWKLLY